MEPNTSRRFTKIDIQKMYALKVLQDSGPQPFNELCRMLNKSPSSLNNIRKELLKERKIEPTIHNGKSAYGITKKGKNSIYDFGILGMAINKILEDGGSYHDDYSRRFTELQYYHQLPWGIQDDITYDKNLKKLLPVSKQTADEVHRYLYNCIKEDVKARRIHLDPTKDGKIILGFTIYYADLVKSINEQSLHYLENMLKEEIDFFDKIGDRTLNSAEQTKLDEIRKRTKAKIGIKLR